jgi:hypothetical protein
VKSVCDHSFSKIQWSILQKDEKRHEEIVSDTNSLKKLIIPFHHPTNWILIFLRSDDIKPIFIFISNFIIFE